MRYWISLATLTAGLLIAGQAIAQGENALPLVPLPSIFDFTRGDGWGIALGAAVEYETAYDGSDAYELEIDPAGAIQWRNGNHLLFWEGMELGWRGRLADVWLVQAGARYEDGLEPDDSEDGNLDGFEERDSHLVGFLEVRRAFGDAWRNWIGARAMGGEADFGWLGVLAAGHRFGARLDGTGTELFAFSTFGTDDFITKDFGVTAADAAASRLPETELEGGYRSSGVTVVDRRYLARHIHLIAQAGAELYSSDIQEPCSARRLRDGNRTVRRLPLLTILANNRVNAPG
ncbi:MAG: MipA/OmpV family protein [Sedimentisphaerales bacterium]|nr:MipA/OmpV family protein [Sedimentisphaerales bacterium]